MREAPGARRRPGGRTAGSRRPVRSATRLVAQLRQRGDDRAEGDLAVAGSDEAGERAGRRGASTSAGSIRDAGTAQAPGEGPGPVACCVLAAGCSQTACRDGVCAGGAGVEGGISSLMTEVRRLEMVTAVTIT